jgi:transcriptional regulator GlxA family with amidase domain
MDERVKEAVLFMEGNCQRKLRLRQIAAVVGLSPSRLSALFLTDLEVSPMRHVKTLRMQQAKALLLSSTLSVKEIAAHVGFNDISHFIRDFSSLYGQAPTTIRNGKSVP